MSMIFYMVANTLLSESSTAADETFSIVAGFDDIKTPTEQGFRTGLYGSVTPSGKFIDIYGTDDHQVDELYHNYSAEEVYFAISGDSAVSNSGWTSITYESPGSTTTTLNRADASYTNIGTNSARWTWSSITSSDTVSTGDVTITI